MTQTHQNPARSQTHQIPARSQTPFGNAIVRETLFQKKPILSFPSGSCRMGTQIIPIRQLPDGNEMTLEHWNEVKVEKSQKI